MRLGEICVKAAPSRQGKRSRSFDADREVSPGEPAASPLLDNTLLQLPSAQFIYNLMDGCRTWNKEVLDILCGLFEKPPSRSAVVWMARHLATLATCFNMIELFNSALKLAAAHGVVFGDVVLDLEKEMPAPPKPQDGALAPQMIDFLENETRNEGTFWVGRRLNPSRKGELVMWASSNFKAEIASEETLRAGWEQATANHHDSGVSSSTAFWDAFVHPDDCSIIPQALGRVMATMATFDPATILDNCESTTVKVRMRRTHPIGPVYMDFQAEVHLGCSRDQIWLGVRARPMAPSPPVALATPLVTPVPIALATPVDADADVHVVSVAAISMPVASDVSAAANQTIVNPPPGETALAKEVGRQSTTTSSAGSNPGAMYQADEESAEADFLDSLLSPNAHFLDSLLGPDAHVVLEG